MDKSLIAVVPLWDDEKQSIWMLPQYMNGIRDAGGIPVILPLDSPEEDYLALFDRCEGLLLTGGHDVDPALYRAEKTEACGVSCPVRDEMEKVLYAKALEEDKPVLGICRGIQLINALEGGTLYQDLPTEYDSEIEHHMAPPYTNIAHYVDIKEWTPLYDLLGAAKLGVNSYHHQAIRDLGGDLQVMAVAEDGLIEAVCRPDKKFVWAVQWHPEFNYEVKPSSRKIFEAFVKACSVVS